MSADDPGRKHWLEYFDGEPAHRLGVYALVIVPNGRSELIADFVAQWSIEAIQDDRVEVTVSNRLLIAFNPVLAIIGEEVRAEDAVGLHAWVEVVAQHEVVGEDQRGPPNVRLDRTDRRVEIRVEFGQPVGLLDPGTRLARQMRPRPGHPRPARCRCACGILTQFIAANGARKKIR